MPTAAPDPRELPEIRVRGNPALSVRVREGEGVPIVLLHGLGRTLEDWEPIALLLGRNHPLYAVDQRGHGLSEDGAWFLDGYVDDLIRVIGHFGLKQPVVVGHHLGGMVAALYGTRREDLTAVVNIEGHGWPRAESVAEGLGLSPENAQHQVTAVRRFAVEHLASVAAPMPLDAFERLVEGLRSGPLGMPGAVLEASVHRAVTAERDVVSPRPGPRAIRALCRALDEFEPDRVDRELRVPALTLVSTVPLPLVPGAPLRLHDVLSAQAAHELTARTGQLTVRGVDAPHTMHLSHPDTVASHIEDFLHAV